MQYVIPAGGWVSRLADAIENAEAGDSIVVRSEAMLELAERARSRMCPEKQITFILEKEGTGRME